MKSILYYSTNSTILIYLWPYVKQPLRKIPIGIPIGIFPIGIPVGIPLGKIPIGIFPTGIPIEI